MPTSPSHPRPEHWASAEPGHDTPLSTDFLKPDASPSPAVTPNTDPSTPSSTPAAYGGGHRLALRPATGNSAMPRKAPPSALKLPKSESLKLLQEMMLVVKSPSPPPPASDFGDQKFNQLLDKILRGPTPQKPARPASEDDGTGSGLSVSQPVLLVRLHFCSHFPSLKASRVSQPSSRLPWPPRTCRQPPVWLPEASRSRRSSTTWRSGSRWKGPRPRAFGRG